MIRLLFILLLAGAIATGLAWLADMEGGLDLVIGTYAIHTGVATAAVLLLIAVAILFFVFRVLAAIFSAPEAIHEWSRARKARRGYLALSRGLVAAAAGDVDEAKRAAAQGEKFLGREPLELLLTAQAAQLDADEGRQTASYHAMLENNETEFLGLRGLYMQAMRKGDEEGAIKYATRANELKPKAAWASNALFDLHVARHEWEEALVVLKKQVRTRTVSGDAARRRRAVLLAASAIDADKEGNGDKAMSQALEAAGLAPGLIPAAALAARKLTQAGRNWKAQDVVEAAWAQAPHPDLAAAYAAINPNDDAPTRARRMRSLTQLNAGHVESRLVAAEQAIAQHQWYDARAALEPITRNFPTARACVLMAEIAQGERGDVTAAQGWLARAARSPRDAQWRCAHCGFVMQDWTAICCNCDAFDSLSWVAPRTDTFESLPPSTGVPIAATFVDVEPEEPRAQIAAPREKGPPVAALQRPPDDPGIGAEEEDDEIYTGSQFDTPTHPAREFDSQPSGRDAEK